MIKMKNKNTLIILLLSIIVLTSCKKDKEESELCIKNIDDQQTITIDEVNGSIWGFNWDTWEYSYLISFDLITGLAIDTIILDNINSGSRDLIFNETNNEFLFTYRGSLYSVNLTTYITNELINIGDDLEGIRVDMNSELIYGLVSNNSNYQIVIIDLKDNTYKYGIDSEIIAKISEPSISTALNTYCDKYYFNINSILYSYNIIEDKIDKEINVELNNIEYNLITNELLGISDFKFIKMTPELNIISSTNISIYAYTPQSSISENGVYLFCGNGNEFHFLNPTTGKIIKTIEIPLESAIEYKKN